MKKMLLSGLCVWAGTFSASAFSSTSILDSISQNGNQAEMMSVKDMESARGAALISGQPYPSVTHGLKKHHVTWKGFGSTADYTSYNYIGNSYTPDHDHELVFPYNGNYYHVGGDQWLADDISSPSAWSLSNAYLKEYHYQVIDAVSEAVTIYAFRETTWNRPITTFSW